MNKNNDINDIKLISFNTLNKQKIVRKLLCYHSTNRRNDSVDKIRF